MAWLLSVSAFVYADNGFAGSFASKRLNLNVKSVTFLHGRQGAKPTTGRTFAIAVYWRRRVWSGMEGACLSNAGNSCLSVKLDDSLFCSSVASMRAWPGRTMKNWP